MDRRSFLKTVVSGTAIATGAAAIPAAPTPPRRRLLLQESPVAGVQHHQGESLWPMLWVGAPLKLARAVALRFLGRKIGYLPRAENTAVSQLIDRGETLRAPIIALKRASDPRKRMRVAVELEA